MVVQLPHIENSNLTNYIPPKGEYHTFASQEEYEERGREWGLFGKVPKQGFWYKGKGYQRLVKVMGYETFGENQEYASLVIEFQDGNLSCILPAYLADMQKSTFGQETEEGDAEGSAAPEPKAVVPKDKPEKSKAVAPKKKPAAQSVTKPPAAKESFELPTTEKVRFQAVVKEFTTKPNPFSDTDDEVLVLEQVVILEEEDVQVGMCWCGYSKTLQSFELKEGQTIEFDAKIVKKKLKDQVMFKINNPSQIRIKK